MKRYVCVCAFDDERNHHLPFFGRFLDGQVDVQRKKHEKFQERLLLRRLLVKTSNTLCED